MPSSSILMMLGLFALTSVVGIGTVRFAIWLSHRYDIMDHPDPRKTHRGPIAYLGGLGMFLAFAFGLLAMVVLRPDFLLNHSGVLTAVMLGALFIFLVGFVDDVRPIPAVIKLGLQIVTGAGMWALGVRVNVLSLLGSEAAQLGHLISFVVTVGWYVALMNAINLVDGLDGLAGGITLIGAVSLAGVTLVINPSIEVVIAAMLSTLIAGSALGFLCWNWHPARIFMGDGGSLLLGFLLASASLLGSAKTSTVLALAVPLVALGLPIFEIIFSFLRRALSGQHPFKPDRRHLHHRLLDLGLDPQRVVILLLFATAFLGINSVILAMAESNILLFNVVFLLAGLLLLIENLGFLEKRRETASREAIKPAPPAPPPSPPDSRPEQPSGRLLGGTR